MKQLTDEVFAQVREAFVKAEDCIQAMTDGPHRGDWGATLDVLEKALAALDTAQPVPEVNSMLVEALKDTAQTLAWMQHGKCRGFSDGLLTTQEALDKAREALTAAKQAQPVRPINCGTGHCSCIECPYEQTRPEPSVPEGWKLVPVVPTSEMIEAAVDRFFAEARPQHRVNAHYTWDAMLAAAPQPKGTK